VPEGQQRIPAYFSTPIYDMDDSQHPDLQGIAAHLSKQLDEFNRCGSGFVLDRITKFTICVAQYCPLHGSSYIATPQWLAKKHAVISVNNTSDSKCFAWSVLAALHPGAHYSDRLFTYKSHEYTLNTSGLTFPIPFKDIPKFEKQHRCISINVRCNGDEGGFVHLYVSKERDRLHHVNLFYLKDQIIPTTMCGTKNMSRLVAGRTIHRNAAFVCNHCIHHFSSKQVHDRPNCQRHPPQYVKYPDPQKPKESVYEFRKYAARFRLSVYLVCDFESFLTPIIAKT